MKVIDSISSIYNKLPLFHGTHIVLYSFLIDLSLQVLLRLIDRISESEERKELKSLNKELEGVNMKEEFARYAKLNRRKKVLMKALSTKQNRISNYIRIYLPCIVFIRCYVTEIPSRIFTPFNRLLYIGGPSDDGLIKVGFPFVWFHVMRWVNFLVRYFFD